MSVLFIIALSLWFYPVIAITIVIKTKRKLALRRKIGLVVLLSLVVIIGCFYVGISTSNYILNWVLMSLVHFTACYLLFWGCWQDVMLVKIISGIGLFFLLIIGYFMGSVGFLGLAYVATEYEPSTPLEINSNVTYRDYGLGNATTSWGGTRVSISKHLSWFPYLEYEFYNKEYTGENYGLNLTPRKRPLGFTPVK